MTILILRHVSGAGSSTLAQSLASTCQDAIICCADDYMMENNKYVFHPSKLGAAHASCQAKFIQACEEKKRLIIVSNTATKVRDFEFYEQNGRKYGYFVHSVVVENRHHGINTHNVPEETLRQQEANIRASIVLR
jgi:hypothetical protein